MTNLWVRLKLILVCLVLIAWEGAWAESGADELLESLSAQPSTRQEIKNNKGGPAKEIIRQARKVSVDFNDPFQRQLFAQVETTSGMSYDLREWTNKIFEGDYAQAAHLWSTIQEFIPESFRNAADSAHLYVLWKLGLNQNFFRHWMKALADNKYAQSPSEFALEEVVSPHLEKWLLEKTIFISPEEEAIISKLDDKKKPFVSQFKAWISVRKRDGKEDSLETLSEGSVFKPYLAQTAAIAHVRSKDLVGAAKILKKYLEPSIETNKDVLALSQHYMNIARVLYQAGQMKASQTFYEKIPNASPLFLKAREELTWVLLRKGETSKLRGELETLSSPLFKEQFAPEIYLVRAISNLKMCFYDAVEKDFANFNKFNSAWAKQIDEALAAKEPPKPWDTDPFIKLSETTVKSLEGEIQKLKKLGEESIAATLPSVGVQKHWKEDQVALQAVLEASKKQQSDEYRRQWKNNRSIMAEAIRKMRFVKVEFLSQVRQLAKNGLDGGSLVADNGNVAPSQIAKEKNQLSFPVDGQIWPDELFKLRSAAQARCLKNSGVK